MIKKLFIACAAFVWTIALVAQNISVVNSSGSTKLYRTLEAAIKGADPNSVIYLPGGGFPIADSVKITKKLTIIGIGHKAKNDNADGVTTISGNLFFNQGSSGSAVMACYITGNVNIGEGGASVNDVLIRYCNLNSVQVNNSICMGTIVNQNYIRSTSNFHGANGEFTNNIAHSIDDIDNGTIAYNVFTSACTGYHTHNSGNWDNAAIIFCNQCAITHNIIIEWGSGGPSSGSLGNGSTNTVYDNMATQNWGEDCINVSKEGFDWKNVFKDYQGVSATSNFHFKEEYAEHEGKVGIYAGDSFNDKQLAPVPYIVAKKIDEQTDAAGKLNIKIRVKASGEE